MFFYVPSVWVLFPRMDLSLIKQKETTHTHNRAHACCSFCHHSYFFFFLDQAPNWDLKRWTLCMSYSSVFGMYLCCIHVYQPGLISLQPPAVSSGRLPDINRQQRANICLVFHRDLRQRNTNMKVWESLQRWTEVAILRSITEHSVDTFLLILYWSLKWNFLHL